MKKVCVITSTRAEYGLLRWTVEELRAQKDICAQLVVTGAHLSDSFGHTVDLIEADGLTIDRKVPYLGEDRSPEGIAAECGTCCREMAKALRELAPDLVLVLGDRYELLPICTAALIVGVPVAHIAGGEVTEGAIDDQVRNAVTMMAQLHFPNSEEALANVVRMRGSARNVFNVGEPGIENYRRLRLLPRAELSGILGLDSARRWVLVTLHPETRLSQDENMRMAESLCECLASFEDAEIVISEANADLGGDAMNRMYRALASSHPHIRVHHSLGQLRYLSFMREAAMVIGNSSSGVIETPYLGTPTINVGDRQKGRRLAANVIQCGRDMESIAEAIAKIPAGKRFAPDHSFGDGETSHHIVEHIKDFLA